MPTRVTLICGALSAHHSQIYTGFAMLERQGLITVRNTYEGSGLTALVGGRRIHFDVNDSVDVDAQELSRCDVYYKRSYSEALLREVDREGKIRPLGLNYEVYPDFVDLKAVIRALRMRGPYRERHPFLGRALKASRSYVPRVGSMCADPPEHLEPRVLFLTRTWEPDGYRPRLMPTRDEINETRADCIRAIRREFGDRAVAGFAPTPHALQHFEALVATVATDKRSYIESLRTFPVCVATTGLHGSIGWKMAEYVAFSRAVASERLNFSAPAFERGRHYLEFDDVHTCLEQVGRLVEDRACRIELMRNCARYYREHLRPDVLVWRALTSACPGLEADDHHGLAPPDARRKLD